VFDQAVDGRLEQALLGSPAALLLRLARGQDPRRHRLSFAPKKQSVKPDFFVEQTSVEGGTAAAHVSAIKEKLTW